MKGREILAATLLYPLLTLTATALKGFDGYNFSFSPNPLPSLWYMSDELFVTTKSFVGAVDDVYESELLHADDDGFTVMLINVPSDVIVIQVHSPGNEQQMIKPSCFCPDSAVEATAMEGFKSMSWYPAEMGHKGAAMEIWNPWLLDKPCIRVGAPDNLPAEGVGQYNCSVVSHMASAKRLCISAEEFTSINPGCTSYNLFLKQGKTYELQISAEYHDSGSLTFFRVLLQEKLNYTTPLMYSVDSIEHTSQTNPRNRFEKLLLKSMESSLVVNYAFVVETTEHTSRTNPKNGYQRLLGESMEPPRPGDPMESGMDKFLKSWAIYGSIVTGLILAVLIYLGKIARCFCKDAGRCLYNFCKKMRNESPTNVGSADGPTPEGQNNRSDQSTNERQEPITAIDQHDYETKPTRSVKSSIFKHSRKVETIVSTVTKSTEIYEEIELRELHFQPL